MKLKDAVFLWMPVDAEIYHSNPLQGKMRVIGRGQDLRDFPMSAGACDSDYNELETDAERFEKLQEYVSVMIWENGVSANEVLAALKVIDDINPLQLDFTQKPF